MDFTVCIRTYSIALGDIGLGLMFFSIGYVFGLFRFFVFVI